MGRRQIFAVIFGIVALWAYGDALGQLREQSPSEPPALEETPPTQPGATPPAPAASQAREKLARVWSNEPPLLRLARDKFGGELTETDAKFFAAVAANDWADLRPASDTAYNAEDIESWATSPKLKADRLVWLCTDPAAAKLVPSRGVWLRGARIEGRIDLYRTNVPFSLTFYDCLFVNGFYIAHAKLEELDIRNSFSAAIQGRGVQIAENLYLLTTSVFGGLDFIDAQIGGDFDFTGGLAFHGMTAADMAKKGVALNFHDAKIGGDLKLGDKFRAYGQVRLIGTQIGRSLICGNGRFAGGGQIAIDAHRARIGSNAVFNTGFRADGGLELRRAHVGGDLDCDGGRFIAVADSEALDADLIDVGGQVRLGSGLNAEGEVRLVNAVVGGDIDCDNGHFLHPKGDALSLDGAVIGRSLRIGSSPNSPKDESSKLPPGFLSRGTVRLWGTQVNQDVLASGAQFEAPGRDAILASNAKVASRVELAFVQAQGTVNLSSADIEHELDLRGSQFDAKGAPNNIAIWASGMHVRGHVYCNQVDAPEQKYRLRVNGLTSFQFATIAMHWDLCGAQFINPGGDALDASDCRVGGYVNLDTVAIDGRATFSRAKIDGMWIINKSVDPQKLRLDMRFAHIWVIKDERLDDWPPAGQLQLEGLVYDHFDDDSPLDVNDRLAWLRRQYAPPKKRHLFEVQRAADVWRATDVRSGSPDPAASADRRSPSTINATSSDQEIVPTQFQAPTMPAPQMAAPAPSPPPVAQPTNRSATPQKKVSKADTVQRAATAPTTTKNATAEAKPNTANDPSTVAAKQPADDDTPTSAADAQPVDPAGRRYITQPYTQLASVYRAIGQDEQASAVLVARAERIGELAPPFSAQGLWYRYLGRLIGYGYEPFRAIKIGVTIIAIGAVIFAIGAHRNLMAETKLAERVLSSEDESGVVSPTYPRFNAIVYSLDVFLPFVDLNQVCYWIPGEKPTKPRVSRNCLMHIGPYRLKWSSVLHSYLWFQTLAGWTLCTLLAAAVTGIVQS